VSWGRDTAGVPAARPAGSGLWGRDRRKGGGERRSVELRARVGVGRV
jgi:hypothetical protein